MQVKLIAHTPNPEQVIAAAAKMCYSNSGIDNILEGLTPDKIQSFIEQLISIGHESPLEHITFTFAVEGISRVCSHQLVRHRIASYSQKSQRYVDEKMFEYIIPPAIENNPAALGTYLSAMDNIQRYYENISDLLFDSYSANGKMLPKDAKKKAQEDARFVLPNACETKLVMTFNVRSLLNFFNERCCTRAQWEIRALANEVLRQVKEVAPTLFMNAGAKCAKGYCPEGTMSCGKVGTDVKKS